jgi:hypothetical protein
MLLSRRHTKIARSGHCSQQKAVHNVHIAARRLDCLFEMFHGHGLEAGDRPNSFHVRFGSVREQSPEEWPSSKVSYCRTYSVLNFDTRYDVQVFSFVLSNLPAAASWSQERGWFLMALVFNSRCPITDLKIKLSRHIRGLISLNIATETDRYGCDKDGSYAAAYTIAKTLLPCCRVATCQIPGPVRYIAGPSRALDTLYLHIFKKRDAFLGPESLDPSSSSSLLGPRFYLNIPRAPSKKPLIIPHECIAAIPAFSFRTFIGCRVAE